MWDNACLKMNGEFLFYNLDNDNIYVCVKQIQMNEQRVTSDIQFIQYLKRFSFSKSFRLIVNISELVNYYLLCMNLTYMVEFFYMRKCLPFT